MKIVFKNISILLLVFVLNFNFLFSNGYSPKAAALSEAQKRALDVGAPYIDTQSGPAACSSGGGLGDELDGHILPATSGGTGLEQHLPVGGPEGDGGSISRHYELTNVPLEAQNGFAGTGGSGGGGAGALPTNVPEEEQWYINMRWRYVDWAWSGQSQSVDRPEEDIAFYQNHPRVLVSNPRTNKSVVTAVIESGPAPWTGTNDQGGSNPPDYWRGFIDGTPPEYTGRVSGLSPEAFLELEAAIKTPDS